jgi:ParB-like chromosome segregation protein Spo0J
MVNLNDIDEGERFRQDYGDLQALAEDISEKGLIQPLAVTPQQSFDKPYKLQAGGRRGEKVFFRQNLSNCD